MGADAESEVAANDGDPLRILPQVEHFVGMDRLWLDDGKLSQSPASLLHTIYRTHAKHEGNFSKEEVG